MPLFSERYGYIKPADVLIRENITDDIENAICSTYDLLEDMLRNLDSYNRSDQYYVDMEMFLWTKFLNQRRNDFYSYNGHKIVATQFVKDPNQPWNRKLDIVELSFKWLYANKEKTRGMESVANNFAKLINYEFERLNFAYRFVDKQIVEMTNKEEIRAIEQCLNQSADNVRLHMSKALELLSKRPVADYRNSIKESISAVEALMREKTGGNTFGDAMKKLPSIGIELPQILKSAFEKLYGYTNNEETGIRHALMTDENGYSPEYEEALFMLISCSAFINYLIAKFKVK